MSPHEPQPAPRRDVSSDQADGEGRSLPVFAYGSNMHFGDLQRWADRRGHQVSIHRFRLALLHNFRLVFNYWSMTRGAGAANVQPFAEVTHREHHCSPTASVPGLLLWVDEATLEALDQKEGHPQLYRRQLLRVETPPSPGGSETRLGAASSQLAWVYVVEPAHTAADFVAPSTYYLSLIRAAAREYQFAAEYQEWLESLPTASDNRSEGKTQPLE